MISKTANHRSFGESPKPQINPIFLPGDEKASSIVCCIVVVLSLSGRTFQSQASQSLSFYEIPELNGIEVVSISGINNHCIAVTKKGEVFVYGRNYNGRLGLGKGKMGVAKFTEVSSLRSRKIKTAYGGYYHSLFQTVEGKILGCGGNASRELFLSQQKSDGDYFEPIETTIENASFCIAGFNSSIIFKNFEPEMCPNKRIDIEKMRKNQNRTFSQKTKHQKQKDLCNYIVYICL